MKKKMGKLGKYGKNYNMGTEKYRKKKNGKITVR